MVAYFRLFLVTLLVMLQFVAPLVHAHVDEMGVGRGLHLHEFETLHIQSDSLFSNALSYADSAQSMIVELGAAIKAPKSSKDISPVYFLHSDLMQWSVKYIVQTVNFSPHTFIVVSEPFPSQNLTRAPPA